METRRSRESAMLHSCLGRVECVRRAGATGRGAGPVDRPDVESIHRGRRESQPRGAAVCEPDVSGNESPKGAVAADLVRSAGTQSVCFSGQLRSILQILAILNLLYVSPAIVLFADRENLPNKLQVYPAFVRPS